MYVWLALCLFTRLAIRLSIRLSISRYIDPSIHTSIHPFSIPPFLHFSIHPSIHPSISLVLSFFRYISLYLLLSPSLTLFLPSICMFVQQVHPLSISILALFIACPATTRFAILLPCLCFSPSACLPA